MRYPSPRTAVIAVTTTAAALVVTALAVSASASTDDRPRSTGSSIVVGTPSTSPRSSTGHEATDQATKPDGDDAYEYGGSPSTGPTSRHEESHEHADDGPHGHESDHDESGS